jgi:hypothetical protein
MIVAEAWITHVAHVLNMRPERIRVSFGPWVNAPHRVDVLRA